MAAEGLSLRQRVFFLPHLVRDLDGGGVAQRPLGLHRGHRRKQGASQELQSLHIAILHRIRHCLSIFLRQHFCCPHYHYVSRRRRQGKHFMLNRLVPSSLICIGSGFCRIKWA